MKKKDYRYLIPIITITALINLITWAVSIWLFPRHSPVVILHYTSGIGIDLIGEGSRIITLPAIGTALLIGNMLLGAIIRPASSASAWLAWGSLPFLQSILLAAVILLYRINV